MANRIQLRRDTSANWTSANPILSEGEIGIETDGLNTTEVKRKIGDGVTAWNSLAYDHSAASVTSVAGKTGVVTLDSSDVGLDQVDNTSDVNKPVSTAQQTALDSKLTINEDLAQDEKVGDVGNANYVELQKDGTAPKVYEGGINTGNLISDVGAKYFANRFIGQSPINNLLAGRNSVMSSLGDSTGESDTSQIGQLVTKLGSYFSDKNVMVEYNDYDDTSTPKWSRTQIYNAPANHQDIRGLKSNGTLKCPLLVDDGEWDSADLSIEFMFSDYDKSVNARPCSKWTLGNITRQSFNVVAEATTGDLILEWSDGVALQSETFSGFLTTSILTDVHHLRLDIDVDDGAGGYTVKLYKSTDLGLTWVLSDTKTGLATTTLERHVNAPWEIHGINQDVANTDQCIVHKFIVYNGIGGEIVSVPVNIEKWVLGDSSDSFEFVGSVPVLIFYNGSISGMKYTNMDITKIKLATVPDSFQTMIINFGHNSGVRIYELFYSDIEAFVTDLNSILSNTLLVFTTQNPRDEDTDPSKGNAYTIELKAYTTRQYANNNSMGCIDTMTYIINNYPDWLVNDMDDYVHPNDTGYEIMASLEEKYFIGR